MQGTDTPSIKYGNPKPDYRALFYSNPEAALRVPVTIAAGYGVLPEGTTLARNGSTIGNIDKCVPYDPTTAAVTGTENAPARAYLVAEGTADAWFFVTIADSYKFVVGDNVWFMDSDDSVVEAATAITAIDRTTYPHMAKISGPTPTTAMNVTKFAYAFVKGAQTAIGILESAIDTGSGEDCADANASMIISNAIFYTGCLRNCDTAAKSALSMTALGQFTYIK